MLFRSYVGIIQIRLWVKTFTVYSQLASAGPPVFICWGRLFVHVVIIVYRLKFVNHNSAFYDFFFRHNLPFYLSNSPGSFFTDILPQLFCSPSGGYPQSAFTAYCFSQLQQSISLIRSISARFSAPARRIPAKMEPAILCHTLKIAPGSVASGLAAKLAAASETARPLFCIDRKSVV